MAKKIWLVGGMTGEYEDHRQWVVCYFNKEADAKKMAECLSARAREALRILEENPDPTAPRKFMEPFDPYFGMDYTGTHYYVTEVEPGAAALKQVVKATEK